MADSYDGVAILDPGTRDALGHCHGVRAERRREATAEDNQEFRSDLRYGTFSRVLPLPVGTSEQDITATYTAGILDIRVSFDHNKAQVTRIPVTAT
jgi:HSP20 family protein